MSDWDALAVAYHSERGWYPVKEAVQDMLASRDAEIKRLTELVEALQETKNWSIHGTWLVLESNTCTCGTPDVFAYGHEPSCGLEPIVNLSRLTGWEDLRQ